MGRTRQAYAPYVATLQPAIASVNWEGLETRFREMVDLLNTPAIVAMDRSKGKHSRTLPPLTDNSVTIGSEARKIHRERVTLGLESIIEMAYNESRNLLSDGDFEEAIRGGLLTLKLTQELYGTNSIEQVDTYFLLAKANQFLNRHMEALEFLSTANWTIIKNPDCPIHIKAELHQNFGLLHVSIGKIDKSIEHLSTCIYYLALLHGTDHLITSFGYFNLGNVFASQGQMGKAIDFLTKVVDLWYRHLKVAFTQEQGQVPNTHEFGIIMLENCQMAEIDANNHLRGLESLDEEKIHETARMFDRILEIEIERFGEKHIETGKATLVYGLYSWWIGEDVKCLDRLEQAHAIFVSEMGEKSANATEVQSIIDLIV